MPTIQNIGLAENLYLAYFVPPIMLFHKSFSMAIQGNSILKELKTYWGFPLFLILLLHDGTGWEEAVVELLCPHREDHQAVSMGLEIAEKVLVIFQITVAFSWMLILTYEILLLLVVCASLYCKMDVCSAKTDWKTHFSYYTTSQCHRQSWIRYFQG